MDDHNASSNHSLNCSICLKTVISDELSRLSGQDKKECHKFFVLVSRYLNFKSGSFKPEETLKYRRTPINGEDVDVVVCERCITALESFTQMYDLWFTLQIEMDRILEEIKGSIRKSEELGENKFWV